MKEKRALGETQTGLGIMEQTEFTFNEEWLSEENNLLSKIDRLEGIILQVEGKEWESTWKNDKPW